MSERFARAQAATSRDFPDGQTAILSPAGDRLLVLNEMGAIVWSLCDGSRSCAEIAAFIGQHTRGAQCVRIERDVCALLGQLREAGLVVEQPA